MDMLTGSLCYTPGLALFKRYGAVKMFSALSCKALLLSVLFIAMGILGYSLSLDLTTGILSEIYVGWTANVGLSDPDYARHSIRHLWFTKWCCSYTPALITGGCWAIQIKTYIIFFLWSHLFTLPLPIGVGVGGWASIIVCSGFCRRCSAH